MIKSLIFRILITVSFIFSFQTEWVFGQLQVTQGGNPVDLVNDVLIGTGVVASNITMTGGSVMYGSFTTGANPTNLGLASGLILTSGSATNAIGPNISGGITTDLQLPGDSLLTSLIPGYQTRDACVLEFDFIPQGDTMRFRYVFGSDEYLEWVGSSYNDVFGFFVSGVDPITYNYFTNKNIAIIPQTVNTPVSINNVNNVSNSTYFVNNPSGSPTIEYDGFTVVLTAWCHVVPCLNYHIKIAVADAGDWVLDSGVFLEAGSFSSNGITTNITYTNPNIPFLSAIEGCNDAIVTIKLPHPTPDGYVIPFSILSTGTAQYGVDYDSIVSPLIIQPGADSGNIVVHAFLDGLTEGPETVGLIIPNTICLSSYDTIYFTILDYTPVALHTTFDDTLVPCGDQVDLVAQQSGGIGPYSFLWSTGISNDTLIINPNITTLFHVSVTDACGYSSSDSTLIEIFGPTAEAGSDTNICTGGAATLTATGGTSYVWSNGMTTSTITVSPTVTTSYIVTVTQVCSDVDTVRVFVNPLPTLLINATQDSVCPGESTTLVASGAQNYSWTSNIPDPSLTPQSNSAAPVVTPPSSILYTLTGTDTNTCTSTTSQFITVKPVPTADFTVSNLFPCDGNSTVLTYIGNAPATSTFLWQFDGGTAYGNGSGPYQVIWDQSGDYIVQLQIDRNGCLSLPFSDTIHVIQTPDAQFDVDQYSGCIPLEIQFTDFSSNVIAGSTYEWSFGNGDHIITQHPFYTYNNSGIYTVTLVVSNTYGCNDTLKKTALIHANPIPTALFEIHPRKVSILDPIVNFWDRSLGGVVDWDWDLGDGTLSDLPDLTHTYADTGTFDVQLVVYNLYGCADTAFGEVKVTPENTLYFPNSFTPNEDHVNDVFMVYGTNIRAFHMKIFNRWGEEIFTSDDLYEGWDGKFKGDYALTGVYTVVVLWIDGDGNKHNYKGMINLLR